MAYKTEQQLIYEWTLKNQPTGRMLGYPDCCIKEFCQLPPALMQNRSPTKMDELRLRMANIDNAFTGFIPCEKHAKLISEGLLQLEDLIQNRSPSFLPFPFA